MGAIKIVLQILLWLVGLVSYVTIGIYSFDFYLTTVGPYLADHPDQRLPYGYATGALHVLPLLVLALRRWTFRVGAVLFALYAHLSLEVFTLGVFSGNSDTTETALGNLSSWSADAGEFRSAMVTSFAVVSLLAAILLWRRSRKHPRPRRDVGPVSSPT